MPIYGYGTNGAPWTICKQISIKLFYKLSIEFKKVRIDNNLNQVFINSVIAEANESDLSVATYDYSKTNMDVYTYQSNLEQLINEANKKISKNKKYDNYKFDIMGNWTIGKVIIMQKK